MDLDIAVLLTVLVVGNAAVNVVDVAVVVVVVVGWMLTSASR